MTTYAEFIDHVVALNVTGVKRVFDAPPSQVAAVDMPCAYPRLPAGREGGMTADGQGGWTEFGCEYVLLLEAQGQDIGRYNFRLAVTMLDNLRTAVRDATLAKSKTRMVTRQQLVNLGGDSNYWAIVAILAANG